MTDNDKAINFVLGSLSPDAHAAVQNERLYNKDLDRDIVALELFYAEAARAEGPASQTIGADASAPAPFVPSAMPNIWSKIEGAVVSEAMALSGMVLEGFGDGAWEPHESPGIEFKTLWDENAILIRCIPGGAQAAHDQPSDQDEHIIVVAGELHMGGRSFATGDYLCVPAGTTHAHMHSPTGCILFTQYR